MNDYSYIKWASKSDSAIEKDLGIFIKQTRKKLNKTQVEVAQAANINRSTLSLLERGEAGTITSLIKILRVLEQLDVLKAFEVHKQVSPLTLAKLEQKQKQRVKKKATAIKTTKKKSDW